MNRKRLPIGIDDFKEIIEDNYYFVDNSSLIKELNHNGAKVTLITRPRRFGKTLNLSMIKYFYDHHEKEGLRLFANLEMGKEDEMTKEAGQYPVVFFTLKGIKDSNWQITERKLATTMQEIYIANLEIKEILSEPEKRYFDRILNGEAMVDEVQYSLKNLTSYLEKYYGKKVIVLIDEYDTPIISGYVNSFFEPIIEFMRNFLTEGLKGNLSLKFAVLTGITRVSKENIFSGLNNPDISTVINGLYGESFGFTEAKVMTMLAYYQMSEKIAEVRSWYNGYQFGAAQVYNPWSLINYVRSGQLRPYWVNTSSDDLIKNLLRANLTSLKENYAALIRGETIVTEINENINYNILKTGADNLWALFLQSGYLKVVGSKREVLRRGVMGELVVDKYLLQIPNSEVWSLYLNIIRHWLTESVGNEMVIELLRELTEGSLKIFSKLFRRMAEGYFSYYDVDRNKGEEFYHAFILGLVVNLMGRYRVDSNRESGYGRSDLLLVPHDLSKRGIIIEIKRIDEEEEENLETAAAEALQQIADRQYRLELEKAGVTEIVEIGIGFQGKDCLLKWLESSNI